MSSVVMWPLFDLAVEILTFKIFFRSPDLCTVSILLYLMVLKMISLNCGVQASLMLFLSPG